MQNLLSNRSEHQIHNNIIMYNNLREENHKFNLNRISAHTYITTIAYKL